MKLAAIVACVLLSWQAVATEIMTGIASVDDGKPTKYDGGFYGNKVATGHKIRLAALTVAHRTLPLGSCIDISRIGPDANVINAEIDDRGPCGSALCKRVAPWLLKRVVDLKPRLAMLLGCRDLCIIAYWRAPCRG